ncbi:transmembrane protein 107-like protein [Zopfochytrium polystomum]|nr:transmembrane protein 107-like protein [Zopfochytrium polystomum]
MRVTSQILIPARFLATVGHIMATVMVLYTKDANLQRAMPLRDTSSYSSFNQSIMGALALTWICFAIELAGLFTGLTIFYGLTNAVYIGAHASATIALCFFIAEAWHYVIYWYIFVFCK